MTGVVQKREGHSYIVIDTQVGGTHEDPGLIHNVVKVSQAIDEVLNKQNNCQFTVIYKKYQTHPGRNVGGLNTIQYNFIVPDWDIQSNECIRSTLQKKTTNSVSKCIVSLVD